MTKLPLHTPDLSNKNYAALAALFPNAVTETIDENGNVVRAIDADVLAQEINTHVVSGKEERYQFTWPDKKKSVLLANSPIAATLRPCRDESINFDNTENLYIEGDNLDVLKLLRETYLNRVKMIYIDPPYNTGNDFIYEDDFAGDAGEFLIRDKQYDDEGNRMERNLDSNGRFHTDWLNMIYPRLRIARDLLTDDGVIFISIANQEIDNMKKICNEIFGISNFIGIIDWESKTKCQNTKTAKRQLQNKQEYILVYKKQNKRYEFILEKTEQREYPERDSKGCFRYEQIGEMSASGIRGRNTMVFSILGVLPKEGNQWKYGKETITEFDKRGDLEKIGDKVYFRIREDDEEEKMMPFWSFLPKEIGTTETAKSELKEIVGEHGFETVKPVNLIEKFIFHTCYPEANDIILDFFSGSATAAHAVMQLNAEDGGKRKFIMVQLPEVCAEDSEAAKAGYKNICEIGKERIRRAGERIVSSNQFSVLREEMKRYGCVKLSRSDCLAESNGFNNGDLQDCEKASEGGTLFAFGSNETCGSVDSVKYSRRTRQEFKQGIPPLSGDSERFEGGTGDTASDMQQGWLPCRYGHFGSDATFKGNRQNAECPNFKTENCPLKTDNYLDIGFRVLKLDSSNMKDVYYTPQDIVSEIGSLQIDLDGFTDNIKPDRTAEDLLFQVMLDFGILLSSKIEKREIGDKTVFSVADNYLIACFDRVTDEIVTEIAKTKPYYAVFRDSSFYNDASLVNFEQIFRTYSPTTVRKVL